jgi:hypothetical protein
MNIKESTLKVIKWVVSIVFFICAFGALFDKAYLSIISFALIGLLFLPPLTELWRTKFPFLTNKLYKGLIGFALLIIASIGLPSPKNSKSTNDNKVTETKQDKKEEPKAQEIVYSKKQLDSIAKEKAREEKLAKEQAEAEQISKDALERKEMVEKQFSAWDGSHIYLTKYIKENMNDPDSYDHIETRFEDKGKYIFIACKFRGSNAFGGKVINYVTAKADIDGNLTEIKNN